MADAPKPANDKKPEVASSSASDAQEAAAKGAAEKLTADSATSSATDKSADKTAGTDSASTSSTAEKPEQKKEGEEKKEEATKEGGEKKEESLSQRLWGFWEDHNEISEIKAALGFGDKTTEADKKSLPKIDVEGDAALAKAPQDKAAPTDSAAVAEAKNETDPLKKNDWGILGDVGNAFAWGVSAITPDPIERVCKGAWDGAASWLGDTASWFGDTFDTAFKSAGIDKGWEARKVLDDSVYSADASNEDLLRTNRALKNVDKEKASENGLNALEKVKEEAKKDGAFKGGEGGAEGEIARMTGKSPEELARTSEMLRSGLKDATENVDAKSNAKVQRDAAGNQRIENPDGSVTLKTADGTTVHRLKDGTETWFTKDNNGFIEKKPDGSWEGAIGSKYIKAIGSAEALIDLKSKFNLTEVLARPHSTFTLGDAVGATDERNNRPVRFDKESGDLIFSDPRSDAANPTEYKVNKDTLQIMVRQGNGEWTALPAGEKPPFEVKRITEGRNKGGFRVGNVEVNAEGTDVDIDRGFGRGFHRLHKMHDGRFRVETETPDPAKPGETARIAVDSQANSDKAVLTDTTGQTTVIDGNKVTRTDKDGNVTLTHDFSNGHTVINGVERTPEGDIRIQSSDMMLRTDGSIINGDGKVVLHSDGSAGEGSVAGRLAIARAEAAEQAKIEAQAASTSAKVQNIGAMALSIARSGDPNALGIMRHLAWAGIGMADAAMGQAAGHMPAMICLSLAKGVAVSALGVTNDQGRALAECNRLGIFDGSTQKEAMIAGSLGSTYITPESAALHFAADRRPKLSSVA